MNVSITPYSPSIITGANSDSPPEKSKYLPDGKVTHTLASLGQGQFERGAMSENPESPSITKRSVTHCDQHNSQDSLNNDSPPPQEKKKIVPFFRYKDNDVLNDFPILQRKTESPDEQITLIREFLQTFSHVRNSSDKLKTLYTMLNTSSCRPELVVILAHQIETLGATCGDSRADILGRMNITVVIFTLINDMLNQDNEPALEFNWKEFLTTAKHLHNEDVFNQTFCKFAYFRLLPASLQFSSRFFTPCYSKPLLGFRVPLFSKQSLVSHNHATHIRTMYQRLLEQMDVCQFTSPTCEHKFTFRIFWSLALPNSSKFYQFSKLFKEKAGNLEDFITYIVDHLLNIDISRQAAFDQSLKELLDKSIEKNHEEMAKLENSNLTDGEYLERSNQLKKKHEEDTRKIWQVHIRDKLSEEYDKDMGDITSSVKVNSNPFPPEYKHLSMNQLIKKFNKPKKPQACQTGLDRH